MKQSDQDIFARFINGAQSLGKKGAILLVVFVIGMNSFVVNPSGTSMRVQNNLTGGHSWYTDEGFRFKAPFMSKVVEYHQEGTVALTDNEKLCDSATICTDTDPVGFADTYLVKMETSLRFTLSKNPEDLETMHDKVLNEENLYGNTLNPFAQDLVSYTASQFRAEDFMQGGQNEFKLRLLDQASKGMLVTKREKVAAVESEVADRDSEREAGQTKVGEQKVYKVTILNNEDGSPLRKPTAIAAYGIKIVPAGINLVQYDPEPRLKDFMTDKQDRVRRRAGIVEDQQNEREQAITSQLTGDRQRIEKQNELLVLKDAATIAAQQTVEVAALVAQREIVERQKVADLAVIDKTRELQVAEANEGIQTANYAASQYEAKAIKEVGFAEAAVDSAKLKAKQDNKTIYLAELENQQALALAAALPQTKIDMPDMVIMGGAGDSGGSLNSLLSTKLMKDVVEQNKAQP